MQHLQDLLQCAEDANPAVREDVDFADRGFLPQVLGRLLHSITFNPFCPAIAMASAAASPASGKAKVG